jgi:hypothetical protein
MSDQLKIYEALFYPHYLSSFDADAALDYVHHGVDMDNLPGSTVNYVDLLPQPVRRIVAHVATRSFGFEGRYSTLFPRLLGLMTLTELGIIESVSAEAMNRPAFIYSTVGDVPAREWSDLISDVVVDACPAYYDMAAHVAGQHTPDDMDDRAMFLGLLDSYVVANRRIIIEKHPLN